jgi:PBSX family phage terminase large subunit
MELKELLEQEAETAEELEEEVEEFKLTPKQDAFVFDKAKFSGYGGGVGNGKSFSGCIKAHLHCDEQPGAFFLIGRRHATDLQDSTQKDFLALFGDEGVFSEKTRSFKYPNGSEIIFRHLDDLRKLTNMNLSGFWIDQAEEVSEEAFEYLNGRIRRQKGPRGQIIKRREGFITFNMEGHNWIWRRFLRKLDKNGEILKNAADYNLVTATSLENPYTPQDYKDTILAMPEEWVKRFVYGDWEQFAGQIFSEWLPAIHVVPGFRIPNSWPRFRTIDHGQNNPTACLWCAVDYDGNVYVYQEYYQPDAPVSQHVRAIQQMSMIGLTGGGYTMDEYEGTYIDPSTHAKTREKNGKKFSVADEYAEAGILTMGAQNDVLAGINRVKEYLRVNPKRWHPIKTDVTGEPMQGAPRLFVFESCINLIEEMGQYKWKPLRVGLEENNPAAPVKHKDHAVDALRYFLMSRPINPAEAQTLDPRLLNNPLELARYCADMGISVDDFIASKYGVGNMNKIGHAESGIGHVDSGISHQDSFIS